MKRSSSAVEYRKMYMTKRWRILRDKILVRDNYQCQHKGCGQFLQPGRNHPRSAVVHHLVPHKGDHGLFYSPNNLQAVCWTCHSGDIQNLLMPSVPLFRVSHERGKKSLSEPRPVSRPYSAAPLSSRAPTPTLFSARLKAS